MISSLVKKCIFGNLEILSDTLLEYFPEHKDTIIHAVLHKEIVRHIIFQEYTEAKEKFQVLGSNSSQESLCLASTLASTIVFREAIRSISLLGITQQMKNIFSIFPPQCEFVIQEHIVKILFKQINLRDLIPFSNIFITAFPLLKEIVRKAFNAQFDQPKINPLLISNILYHNLKLDQHGICSQKTIHQITDQHLKAQVPQK